MWLNLRLRCSLSLRRMRITRQLSKRVLEYSRFGLCLVINGPYGSIRPTYKPEFEGSVGKGSLDISSWLIKSFYLLYILFDNHPKMLKLSYFNLLGFTKIWLGVIEMWKKPMIEIHILLLLGLTFFLLPLTCVALSWYQDKVWWFC